VSPVTHSPSSRHLARPIGPSPLDPEPAAAMAMSSTSPCPPVAIWQTRTRLASRSSPALNARVS
jgi:hypothetical protein